MENKKIKKDLGLAKKLVEKHDEFLILTHHDPDGDALGAVSAIDLAFKRIGKKTICVISGSYPDNYHFLPLPLFEKEIGKKSAKCAIIVDCADLQRTGYEEIIQDMDIEIINIDHHPQENPFGNVNIIDEQSSSSSELVFYLLKELGIKIDKDLADLILTGIISDTGNFMHSNTTKKSLDVASFLVLRGANIKNISSRISRQKRISTLKLWGRVLSRIKKDRSKGIVTSVITKKDLKECDATKEDLEGVVNLISSVSESKAALLLREDEEGLVRGSLRSETGGLDVKKMANVFGGGGHVRASGFKIKGRIGETSDGWEIIDES